MADTEIYFQKSFQVGDFLYYHLGVTKTIHPGETAEQKWEEAEQQCNAWHLEKHKDFEEQKGTKVVDLEGNEIIEKKKATSIERKKLDNAFTAGDNVEIERLNKIYDFA